MNKLICRIRGNRRQIFWIPGVRQLVQVDDWSTVSSQPAQHKIRTDKSGASCDQDGVQSPASDSFGHLIRSHRLRAPPKLSYTELFLPKYSGKKVDSRL